jgi:hypothetical protein
VSKQRKKEQQRQWNIDNAEWVKQRSRQYVIDHKEEISIYKTQYRKDNYKKIFDRQKAYVADNEEARREYITQYDIEHREEKRAKNKTHSQTLQGKYTHYKSGAKKRNIDFDLTIEQFETFWQQPCAYCGSEIETIGVDRIDNTTGYSIANCNPCCVHCNRMKLNHTLEFFIEHINKIYAKIPTTIVHSSAFIMPTKKSYKNYICISPDVIRHEVTTSLADFCRQHKLSLDTFKRNMNKGIIKISTTSSEPYHVNTDGWEVIRP